MYSAVKRRLLAALPPAVAGRLRAWRLRWMVQHFRPRVVEHTYGNGRLKVRLADPLAVGWYDADWAELPEIAALRASRLVPGATVFDIGAHQGVVAMMLAREVGPTGRVVAVEGLPHNAAAAAENARLNGMEQITVVPAAVSDRPGTLVFNQSFNGQIDDGSGAYGRVTVEATTVDLLADRFGPPDVLFVDIEGAECLALAAAGRALAGRPAVFVEVHVGQGLEKLGGSVERVLGFFPPSDYTLRVRAEADTEFRPWVAGDPVVNDRFFLLATPNPG